MLELRYAGFMYGRRRLLKDLSLFWLRTIRDARLDKEKAESWRKYLMMADFAVAV